MTWRRVLALIGLVIGLLGLAINLVIILPSLTIVSPGNPIALSLPAALVNFWTYFTHLTNLGLVLAYVASLTGWRSLGWLRGPRTRAAMAAYITLVMVYYHFMLAPHLQFEGALLVATLLLHYAAPLCYLGWWAALPHGQLRPTDLPWMLVPGLAYVGWVLARGALTEAYPYDILDVGRFGYLNVGIGVGVLALVVLGLAGLVLLADRLLAGNRRRV